MYTHEKIGLAVITVLFIILFGLLTLNIIERFTPDINTQNTLGIIQQFEKQRIGSYEYTRISYENKQYLLIYRYKHFEIIKL